jgi:iron complex outermembrane receptor protein
LGLSGDPRGGPLSLSRNGINFDGTIPAGLPFSTTWTPVSYRAATTFEPVKGLMVYGMYATAYDPAAVGIFSVTPATTLALTSARILETGLKFITPDQRTELTFAAYDIDRRNVYVALTNAVSTLAGEITTKGVDLAGGFRPVDHLKIWGNVTLTESQYGNFDVWSGNTPSNVAPLIINAGASRRFDLRNMVRSRLSRPGLPWRAKDVRVVRLGKVVRHRVCVSLPACIAGGA